MKKKTRPTRSRVVYGYEDTRSPVDRCCVTAGRFRELVTAKVGLAELSPEMSADPDIRLGAERASCLRRRRVHQSDWHELACSLNRESQIRVVGDDKGSVDIAAQDVKQQVRCHIYIAALLLPMGYGDHEPCVVDRTHLES